MVESEDPYYLDRTSKRGRIIQFVIFSGFIGGPTSLIGAALLRSESISNWQSVAYASLIGLGLMVPCVYYDWRHRPSLESQFLFNDHNDKRIITSEGTRII